MLIYDDLVVAEVLRILTAYLKQCIQENLIGESSYVDWIIANIKEERSQATAKTLTSMSERISTELNKVTSALNTERSRWKKIRDQCDRELTQALNNQLGIQEAEEQALNENWSSERKRAKFNNPSQKLIALREEAHALLVARNFTDAKTVAAEVQKLELTEAEAAYNSMLTSYKLARSNLEQKFQRQKEALQAAYQAQVCSVCALEERAVMGFEQRMRHLIRVKEFTDLEAKKKSHRTVIVPVRKVPVTECAPIALLGRLVLPPLKIESRARRNTEAGLEVVDGVV
jgi:Arc/MetJ family transcription regulator